jgi:hypothetical protein
LKEQIERHLQQLTELRLSKTTRAANMECLKFGHLLETNNAGQQIEIGEFALHLQCPWRFTNNTKILVGSFDLYEPADENAEYDEDFDWDKSNVNLRDVKLQQLIETQNLSVISIIADNFGGFDLTFNNNIKLSVFPADSKISEYSELWRLLNNKSTNKEHFVISGHGIQPNQNDLQL